MDGLGDHKPSLLMNDMLILMDGHKPCLLFDQVFLGQMPEDICLVLANEDFSDPRRLAAHADILWQAKQQEGAAISQVTTLPQPVKCVVTEAEAMVASNNANKTHGATTIKGGVSIPAIVGLPASIRETPQLVTCSSNCGQPKTPLYLGSPFWAVFSCGHGSGGQCYTPLER